METRVSTTQATMKAVSAFIVACVVVCLLWCAPRAWAGEYDDIPRGVLTLCDDPFAIDCGHNHSENDDPSQVCHSASPICHPERSEESPGTPASPDAGSSLEAPPFAQDDMGGPSVIHNNSTGVGDTQQLYHLVGSVPSSNEFGNPLASPQDEDVLCHSEERSDEESHSSLQTPSSGFASIVASNEDAPIVSIASYEDIRVIVDDEGLGRHEAASILVELKPGISRIEFDKLLLSAGGLSAKDVSDEDLAYGLVRLCITDGSSVMDAVGRITQTPGFLSVQPNYVYSVDNYGSYTSINDRYAYEQWELNDVEAYAAWDVVKVQHSVAVAVIDTGADLDHPDLASNIVASYNSLSSANVIDDQIGHGSHVAGIVAGVTNNGIGVSGVSYNAGLVIIKASPYNSSDFDTAAIVRAYAWLASKDSSGGTVAEHFNVRVINLSLGGIDSSRSANLRDDALIKAIIKARDELGILTVISAGNGAASRVPFATYPGDTDACICVMNLDKAVVGSDDTVAVDLHPSSNYNLPGTSFKDICAPGTDITSTWVNGKYARSTGTSMAAPMVAGIAAMLFAANPNLTPQMAMSILEFTAVDLGDEGWDERFGFGEVNAAAAVRLASEASADGFRVVGVGGSAGFTAFLGFGMETDGAGWTWTVRNGSGAATVDEYGVLTGTRAGKVTLVASCRTAAGAEVTTTKTVSVLNADIAGRAALVVGSSLEFKSTDTSYTWVWQVENDTGEAHIDQDAILVADKAGVVYVTATCASNTDIVLRKKVTIVA